MILWHSSALTRARAALAAGDENVQVAADHLRAQAETAMGAGPFSVTYKKRPAPSGDVHDYLSVGPYWWPNPDTADGLPYVRRDGRTNPERTQTGDYQQMSQMAQAATTLSLAWYFFGEQRYAEHAAMLLRVWFVDPATRMNPHLRYGQAIPGICDGRGIGIIDTFCLTTLPDAMALLADSPGWRASDQQGILAWLGQYTAWLRDSDLGRAEAAEKNNHGTWYDAQVCIFARATDQRRIAMDILAEVPRKRIDAQIEPDGRQPLELKRTKAMLYSLHNLGALLALGHVGEQLGVDLWNYQSADGRSIRSALLWLTAYVDPAVAWPYQELEEPTANPLLPIHARDGLVPLLREAGWVWPEIKKLPQMAICSQAARVHRSALLWPVA